MPDVQIDLEELVSLVRDAWPNKYARGRLLHMHRNAVRLASGGIVHLRVSVQQIAEPDPTNDVGGEYVDLSSE